MTTERFYTNTAGSYGRRRSPEGPERRASGLHHFVHPGCSYRFHCNVLQSPCFRGSGAFLFHGESGSAVCTVVWTASGLLGVIPEHSGARTPPLVLDASKCSEALKKGSRTLQSIPEYNKCERQELNLHGFPHWILSPARLPIPPLSQIEHYSFSHNNLRPISCPSSLACFGPMLPEMLPSWGFSASVPWLAHKSPAISSAVRQT